MRENMKDFTIPFVAEYSHTDIVKNKLDQHSKNVFYALLVIMGVVLLISFILKAPWILFLEIPILFVLLFKFEKTKIRKILFLGPRYLFCGNRIIYYKNIKHINKYAQIIEVVEISNKIFLIERNKFVSHSRKSEKIKAKLDAKFGEAAKELLERVKFANPNVTIEIR